MRSREQFNYGWKFHLGELDKIPKVVRKAAAIGGYTSVIDCEEGEVVPIGGGGHHFLNLISGGDEKLGLKMLASTTFDCTLDNWVDVNLPHDWKRELEYKQDFKLLMGGFKPEGIGYYRKTFNVPDEVIGKKISIVFEGVLCCSSVWFNGCFLGEHYSGYTGFQYDITDMIHYGDEGDNVILVRVDTTQGQEGWWYEGAGIYRNVHLETTDKLHLDLNGIHTYTDILNDSSSNIIVEADIKNDYYHSREAQVKVTIFDNNNLSLASYDETIIVPKLGKRHFSSEIIIDEPKLWCHENPYLYKVRYEVCCGQDVIDSYETNFGIRTIDYTTEGLLINGKLTEIKGVCEHQDFGGVGTALTKDINRYKLKRLKEMGVNAYRCAHHAASVDLLGLCDEIGIYVMEENRVLESSEVKIRDLEDMIRRDRNHPSIIFWSLCNEEVIGSTNMAERMARSLAEKVRKLDSKRLLVSAELLSLDGQINPHYMDIFDVIGVNYPESVVMGQGLENIKNKFPNKPIMSTENASYFSTRGIYKDNWDKCQTNNYRSQFSMFGKEQVPLDAPGAGGTAYPEKVLDFYENHKFMGGSFLWTAFDYYGEPAPFGWPAISSQFGIMDLCGFPKDYFYYYKSKWNNEPMVYAMGHWNWNDNELREVRVFSNCDEVELVINNNSYGKKNCGKHSTIWHVNYEPGELNVIGYIDGVIVAEDKKYTADLAQKLAIRRIDSELSIANKNQTLILEVYALDKENIEQPIANNMVTINIEGVGEIIGICNGDPMDQTLKGINNVRLFSGKLAVIVQMGTVEGAMKLKVDGDNLESCKYIINVK